MHRHLALLTLATSALAQAPDNTLWATNFSGSIKSISKIDPIGEVLLSAVPSTLTPFGLAVDAAGDVWCGSNGTMVGKTDSAGTVTQTFPVGSFPQSVAVDQTGSIWVANRSSNTVTKLDSFGAVQVTVPLPSGTSPIGVVVDLLGQIWVTGFHSSSATTHTLTVLDLAGNVINTFSYPLAAGVTPNFGFSFPAADPNTRIWVANQSQSALLQIDQTGAVVTTTPISTGLPRGCAVDGLGYVWIANQGFAGNCMKIDPAGVVVASFPPPNTTFTTVSIDGNGDPWVFGATAGSAVGKAIKLWQVDATPLVEVILPSGGSAWGGDSSGFHLARTILPSADFDTDGFPNFLEINSGTNPFEARSTPAAPLPIQSGIPVNGTTIDFTFRLRSDANLLYVAAISLSNGPLPLPDGRFVPLGNPFVIQSFGLLDANGDARTSLALPGGPGLAGLSFYMAYVTLDPAASLGIRTISNDLAVTLR